jgi:predicted permease
MIDALRPITKVLKFMFDILAITIPFFALIFLGAGSKAIGFVGDDGARILSNFAFFVALPAFMFLAVASNNAADFFNLSFLWRYELATILIFGLSGLTAHYIFALSRKEAGIFGLNSAYPNYGYIGVPLVIMAFGEEAALPMGLMLFADTVVLLGMTALFIAGYGQNPLKILWNILLTMTRNPLLLSVLAGLAFAASGLKLPAVMDNLLVLLAGAAAPTALFALGATMYGQPIRNAAGQIGTISLIKLIIHPALVAAFFVLIPGMDPLWGKVAIVASCLPVAANVYMLSQVYNTYVGRTASSVLASTTLATFTLPLILYFVYLL